MPPTGPETKIYSASPQVPGAIRVAAAMLRENGLVVFPTDTVYGLGCMAASSEARRRVFDLKGRETIKPLPLLVGSRDMAVPLWRDLDPRAKTLMDTFWPGPLTLVAHTSAQGRLVAANQDTVALRMPDHPVALALIQEMNSPLAVTSANLAGLASAKTGEEAIRVFQGQVDVIFDGGACPVGRESTVLDVTVWPPKVLRAGALTLETLLHE